MDPQLYVMSIGDKHYVSGTVYTPKGIRQYNGVLDEFEQIFVLFPTFATLVNCPHDEVCIRDHITYFYYLTYSDTRELKKMLKFMGHASIQYLDFIPSNVIREMDIHFVGTYITLGGTDISQNVDCKVIGSTPAEISFRNRYIFINGVQIGEPYEGDRYIVCGKVVDLSNGLESHIDYLLACYFLKHYKGTLTWSKVLKTWCGTLT